MGGEEGKCSSRLDEIKPSKRPFLVLLGKINHAVKGHYVATVVDDNAIPHSFFPSKKFRSDEYHAEFCFEESTFSRLSTTGAVLVEEVLDVVLSPVVNKNGLLFLSMNRPSPNFKQRFDEKIPKTWSIHGTAFRRACLVSISEGTGVDVTTKGFLTFWCMIRSKRRKPQSRQNELVGVRVCIPAREFGEEWARQTHGDAWNSTSYMKGTLGPRPPYEEPRSPLHPGSPNQGPQDSVILAYAWVVPSGLIGDRQSPPTPPPLFLHRERGAVAVGSVEPRVDLSRRCSSNRSCRALRVEGFGSMDPDL
eukprot:scaffold1242_cov332-Pavlova_lutheri.AAC.2